MSKSLLNSINIFDKLLLEHGGSPIFKAHIELLREQARFLESKVADLEQKATDLERKIAGLERKIVGLEQKTSDKQIEIDNLKEEINITKDCHKKLEKQLEEFQKWPPLEFDPKTGTWVNTATQIHYCPSCKSKNIFAPLQKFEHGWKCNVKECDKFYNNPDVSVPVYQPVRSRRGLI